MSDLQSLPLTLLDTLPSRAEFYGTYWSQRPFVVRAAIPVADFENLITGEELAGLSLEDAPLSRLMKTVGDSQDWTCRFGPFCEQDFVEAGDEDWTLLVQNVEQFHPDTGDLLRHFEFTPRWLMDDIMVSYSEKGGSVGPHIDNYHVFLVQGQGRRHWKVGQAPLHNETYIEGLDFRILEHGFEGDEVELAQGDILYLPPRFAHEGTTLESALTYSVGFLGPKISELMASYGVYLSQFEDQDQRYIGAGLELDSTGFNISENDVSQVRNHLMDQLKGQGFAKWLVEFFSENSHENFATYTKREDALSRSKFEDLLKDGVQIFKPTYVKFVVTAGSKDQFYLGFERHSFVFDQTLWPMVTLCMKEGLINPMVILENPAAVNLAVELYNHQALEFED